MVLGNLEVIWRPDSVVLLPSPLWGVGEDTEKGLNTASYIENKWNMMKHHETPKEHQI